MTVRHIIVVLLILLLIVNYSAALTTKADITESKANVIEASYTNDYWGPNYYVDKKYTIVFFADGSKNASNGKPSMTWMWYFYNEYLGYLKSSVLSRLTLMKDLEMYHYLKEHQPPSSPWQAIVQIKNITKKSIIYNNVPRGILIVMGHFSPNGYAPYTYNYSLIATNPPIRFPSNWAKKTSSIHYPQISVSANSIAGYIRNMPWRKLPAVVLLLGCESTNSKGNKRGTWRWAFRFSKIDNDFPDYWIGRALIGADSALHIPVVRVTHWQDFIAIMLSKFANNAKKYNIMKAIEEAVKEVKRYNNYYPSKYGLVIYVDWIDDQGYGRIKYEIGNKEKREIIHIFTYANLYIDPSSEEEAKLEARKISIDWIRHYLRIRFPELYNYLNTNGFVIENVTNFWHNLVSSGIMVENTPIEAREALLKKYQVLVSSKDLEIELYIDVVEKHVEMYSIEMDAPRNVVEEVFGKNISSIWRDNDYWVSRIKELGVELEEEKIGSNAYFWNNASRGYQVQINYNAMINGVYIGEFMVSHINKSNIAVRSGLIPPVFYWLKPYYGSVNIEYYNGYSVHVSYWNELPGLYHELYRVKDKLPIAIRLASDDKWKLSYSEIKEIVDKILDDKGEYNIGNITTMIAHYNETFEPTYYITGYIMMNKTEYYYTIILFPRLNDKYYVNIVYSEGKLILNSILGDYNVSGTAILDSANDTSTAINNSDENTSNNISQLGNSNEYVDKTLLLIPAIVIVFALILIMFRKYR